MTELRRLSLLAFSAWVVLVALSFVNMSSAVSWLFFAAMFLMVWVTILRWQEITKGLAVFVFYSAIAVALYCWQLFVLPEYFGFSGGLGVGTDDSYFFSLAAPELPADFPARDGYWLRSHAYSNVLKIFAKIFVAMRIDVHPLDLLFFNVLGLSLVPFLASKVTYLATKDPKAAVFVFWTAVICPFLISNGLVLVREGWMAMFFIGAFYFAMCRRYVLLAFALLGALYFRIEVGALLAASVIAFLAILGRSRDTELGNLLEGWKSRSTILSIFSFVVILAIGLGAWVGVGGLVDIAGPLLYREDFLESFIGGSGPTGGGTLYQINQLPWFLSIPLGFLFFTGSPFFTTSELMVNGEFIPRVVLANAFAVLFIYYFSYFVRGLIRAFTANNAVMLVLALIFLFDILVLSQASMQIRHKVALMPLFYVILGYGFSYRSYLPLSAGIVGSVTMLVVTLFVQMK